MTRATRTGSARESTPAAASKMRLRLWLRLLRTTREIEAELRDRLRVGFDTTLPRFDVMAALERSPQGLTMTALSRQLLVSNGNITGIVDRLVADGLAIRLSNARDRRTSFVRMTPKGARTFAAMARQHERWIDARLGTLSPADLDQLDVLLARARISRDQRGPS